jgi:hypothetical protein
MNLKKSINLAKLNCNEHEETVNLNKMNLPQN